MPVENVEKWNGELAGEELKLPRNNFQAPDTHLDFNGLLGSWPHFVEEKRWQKIPDEYYIEIA